MEQEYLQLGGVVVIAISLIELIKFIITKYTTQKNNGYEKKMYEAVSNHMTTQLDEGFDRIVQELNTANKDIVKAIHDMHLDIIKEIKNIKS